MTDFQNLNPTSTQVLWQGSPSDFASVATGGRVSTAGYTLTADALRFASGVLSSREEAIPLWAVRDADVIQTMAQKARGVADLRLVVDPQFQSSFGQAAVLLRSLRDARQIRDMILQQANSVRRYWADVQQNRTIEANRAAASQITMNPAAAASASGGNDDLMNQLTKLGEMRTAGLLTGEEFAAAKARLLGL